MPDRILRNAEDVDLFIPAPGYEGRLEFTASGRIRSVERTVASRYGSTRTIPGKELRPFLTNGGYPAIQIRVSGKRKNVFLHKLSALAFVPNPARKPYINHKDADKTNSHPDNLEWCTHAENMAHASRMGLMKGNSGPGESSPAAKLTWDSVATTREMLRAGRSLAAVGRDFGVTYGTVAFIRDNVTWRV